MERLRTVAGNRVFQTLFRLLPTLIAFATGVAWFFHLGLGEAASPFHLRWSFNEDWSVGTMGFLFYRNAPWRFPVGFAPNYFEPYGTTVGYTDGVPALAPFAKLIAPLFPINFQYIGPYWLVSYGLLAVVGERIVARQVRDPIQRILGGALFALSPVIAARTGHPTLCALFLPATAIHLALFRPQTFRDARKLLLQLLALAAFASGSHPYLATMTAAIVFAAVLGHVGVDRVVPRRWIAVWLGAPVVLVLFCFWLFGFVGFQEMDRTADGFGEFSMDLFSFVNPSHRSRFFAGLPMQGRQMEGFNYLGVGVLGLLAVRLLLAVRRLRIRVVGRRLLRAVRRNAPLFAIVGLFAIFALSWSVRARGVQILDLKPLYAPIFDKAAMYRASGRFGWPLHLLLLAGAATAVARFRRRPWIGRALLLIAVVSQGLEAKELERKPHRDAFTPFPDDRFAKVVGDYDHFALVPIQLQWICRYNDEKMHLFVYEAAKRKMGLNSAYVGRAPKGSRALCDVHLAKDAPLDPRTIYVVDRDYYGDFVRPDVICADRDDMHLCVIDRKTPFADSLRPRP